MTCLINTHIAYWKYWLTLEASAAHLVAPICLVSGLRELQMKSNPICMIFLPAHLGLIRWMCLRKGKGLRSFSGREDRGWIRNLEVYSPHYPAHVFSSCNLTSVPIWYWACILILVPQVQARDYCRLVGGVLVSVSFLCLLPCKNWDHGKFLSRSNIQTLSREGTVSFPSSCLHEDTGHLFFGDGKRVAFLYVCIKSMNLSILWIP